MPPTSRDARSEPQGTLDERTRALKERIYATFTGLAILTAVASSEHATASGAFWSVGIGILAISAAGFLAEVVSHMVNHGALPKVDAVRVMARIALGALGSAILPVLLLFLAWAGPLSLEWALGLGLAVYAATLALITLVAARRTTLGVGQRLVASGMLLGLGAVVTTLLLLAHSH